MNVIRTFHPVGQGAFYSERFYTDPQIVHNIVYDCGAAWGYKGRVKHVVAQAFTKHDNIDYLFISHLDYDHVSLIETLLSSVKRINNIVLPLVTIEQLVIIMAYHKLSGHDYMVWFLRKLINHLIRNGDDFLDGDYTIHFVGDPEERDLNIGNAVIWRNGAVRTTDWEPEWVFIPYNVQYRTRKQELIIQLDYLLTRPEFNREIQTMGEGPFQNGTELYEKLKDATFVERVLDNDKLKRSIKRAYDRVTGGINENSLLLYSGPAEPDNDYITEICYIGRPCYRYCRFEAACLFTGDSTFDMNNFRKKYAAVWNCIGTIQLPHHGSADSFDVNTNPIDRPYLVPVSCGCCNSYGHPSGIVLAHLLRNDCCVQIVTELGSTISMQKIRKV